MIREAEQHRQMVALDALRAQGHQHLAEELEEQMETESVTVPFLKITHEGDEGPMLTLRLHILPYRETGRELLEEEE